MEIFRTLGALIEPPGPSAPFAATVEPAPSTCTISAGFSFVPSEMLPAAPVPEVWVVKFAPSVT